MNGNVNTVGIHTETQQSAPQKSEEGGEEPRPSVTSMVEEVLKCKWALSILSAIRRGICRPGAIERSLEGLTTKVMNERLAKLVRFGVLERVSYPEVPPRVEYHITSFGERFSSILDAIAELEHSKP